MVYLLDRLASAAYAGGVTMTLRTLLAHPGLGLRLMSPDRVRPEQLDVAVAWAHSSNLEDPTPWLEPGQLLLTDGTQFQGAHTAASFIDDYAHRLRAAGVVALGFAVNVIHTGVPQALIAAMARHELPLFTVPATTPFIRISRTVADAIATQRSERMRWSIRAQRAIARATLQPEGMAATLRELAKQLDSWVVLYDSLGRRVPVAMSCEVPEELTGQLDLAVRQQLRGQRRSSARLSSAAHTVTLHTIGQPERLRGVLAIGSAEPLDAAGAQLLSSVVGIAQIAVEQSRVLDAARRNLRTGAMELYLAGADCAARRVLRDLDAWVPAGQLRVVFIPAPEGASQEAARLWERALDELEVLAVTRPLTFGRHEHDLLIVQPADAELPEFIARDRLTAGVSGAVAHSEIAAGMRDARHAVTRASRRGDVVWFDHLAEHGLLAWLDAAQGRLLAERLLENLTARPDAEELLEAARAWFHHNCAWDPAARSLGIHRHTLRARIGILGEVTGFDVENFGARAQLWLALQLAAD